MRRIAEQFRRIKGRNVIAEKIIASLKRGPRGINDETAEADEHEKRLKPPNIGPHRFAERAPRNRGRRRSAHFPSAPSTGSFAFVQASQLPGTFQRLSKPSSFKILAAILARYPLGQ